MAHPTATLSLGHKATVALSLGHKASAALSLGHKASAALAFVSAPTPALRDAEARGSAWFDLGDNVVWPHGALGLADEREFVLGGRLGGGFTTNLRTLSGQFGGGGGLWVAVPPHTEGVTPAVLGQFLASGDHRGYIEPSRLATIGPVGLPGGYGVFVSGYFQLETQPQVLAHADDD